MFGLTVNTLYHVLKGVLQIIIVFISYLIINDMIRSMFLLLYNEYALGKIHIVN